MSPMYSPHQVFSLDLGLGSVTCMNDVIQTLTEKKNKVFNEYSGESIVQNREYKYTELDSVMGNYRKTRT